MLLLAAAKIEPPDWVHDNSIKFMGKAGAAAASSGVTGAASATSTKQAATLAIKDDDAMVQLLCIHSSARGPLDQVVSEVRDAGMAHDLTIVAPCATHCFQNPPDVTPF